MNLEKLRNLGIRSDSSSLRSTFVMRKFREVSQSGRPKWCILVEVDVSMTPGAPERVKGNKNVLRWQDGCRLKERKAIGSHVALIEEGMP